MNRISVVIPTYNRREKLEKALQAYGDQSAPEEIREVLVVDDGSTDGTEARVAEIGKGSPFSIRYFRQEHKGPAAARNLGIRESQGELVLFTDDDIIPGRRLVAEHAEWHRQHPELFVAVLGYVPWSPEVRPTPLMEWLSEEGPLFGFKNFAGQKELNFLRFYSCNLSLKAGFLRTCGTFDEDFKSAAWEDIELGCRLENRGMKLLYNPQAIGYHLQYFSFSDVLRRIDRTAAGYRVFKTKEAHRDFARMTPREASTRRRRFKLWLLDKVGAGLLPLRPLLDSRIPLPSLFYRALHAFYANRVEKSEERQLQPLAR